MSHDFRKQTRFAQLSPQNRSMWSILPELAAYTETELRAILRPHDEAGLTWSRDLDVIQLRTRLDDALDALTLLEIAFETGVLPWDKTVIPELESLKTLFQSESLLNYANVYLYFGIRLLAYRIAPPSWRRGTASKEIIEHKSNERSFPLVTPPVFEARTETDKQFERLFDMSMNGAGEGLRFLDGFRYSADEPQEFELWLRGLFPVTDEEKKARFELICAELMQWAKSRSAFYLSLQPAESVPPSGALSKGPTQEEGASRPLGGWVVVNPLAARFALIDVYWIARLLRADVWPPRRLPILAPLGCICCAFKPRYRRLLFLSRRT